MRVAISALAVLLCVNVAFPQADAARSDLERMQGTWQLVSARRDGRDLPPAEQKNTHITISGSKFTFPDESGIGTSQSGTIKLDPSHDPKWIDSTSSGADGKVSQGIYELTEDGYRVCFAPPGQPRPENFASAPGSQHNLQVWRSAELMQLSGHYVMVSGSADGKVIPEETVKAATLEMDGNRHVARVGEDKIVGTHTLRANQQPSQIDATDTEGPHQGTTYLGIYRVEGDVFTVYFSPSGKDRPQSFASQAGPGEILHVWKKRSAP